MRQFNDGMLARVQHDGEFSDPFPVTNGVKQGCVLASKKVREKSREWHNHKPQPFPDPKRKRKPTNLNKLQHCSA